MDQRTARTQSAKVVLVPQWREHSSYCGAFSTSQQHFVKLGAMTTIFDRAFGVVLGSEGGFTKDPRDAGNWTGGRVGQGQLRGTRHGISAASYPQLDIATLTPDDARAIYRRDYWDRLRADELPPSLALLAFDAAVNCGVTRSARWLQSAVGAHPDGAVGPRTLLAVQARGHDRDGICAEMLAARLLFMSNLPTWPTFGPGWARRLCRLLFEAARMETSSWPI